MDADTSVVKKKHEWNPMACEEERMEKLKDMEGKGEKAMDTNTGGSPGYQSQSQQPGSSSSEGTLDTNGLCAQR